MIDFKTIPASFLLKVICAIFLFLSALKVSGQIEDIKKLIYDDLILFNDASKLKFLQKKQIHITVNDSGEIVTKKEEDSDDIRHSYNYLKICQVDSFGSFYFVKAKFILTASLPLNVNFFDSCFSYVIYRSHKELLRVNGFFISDIMNMEPTSLRLLSKEKFEKIFGSKITVKKMIKLLQKRESEKIRSHLRISFILEKVKYPFLVRVKDGW